MMRRSEVRLKLSSELRDALTAHARSVGLPPWGLAAQILRAAAGLGSLTRSGRRHATRYEGDLDLQASIRADSEERAAYSSTAAAEGLTVAAWARRELAAWLESVR